MRREPPQDEAPTIGDDEDTGAHVTPIVKLEEVAVTTGEEDEDAILDLYAFLPYFYFCFLDFIIFTLIGAVDACKKSKLG